MNLENLRKVALIILLAIFPLQLFALDRVVLSTNWLAQAEHGGFYQALAQGIYAKYDLDVEIDMKFIY